MESISEAHADEHIVPADMPNRNLHPEQFGATSIGARSLNRVGSTSGTEMSEDAHNVAGAGRGAARLVEDGDV